jgi:hypothetical protein
MGDLSENGSAEPFRMGQLQRGSAAPFDPEWVTYEKWVSGIDPE